MIISRARRAFSTVGVKSNPNGVVSLTLEMPTMGLRFWDEFLVKTNELRASPSARCIVLSSNAKAFSFGLDVKDTKQNEILLSSGLDPARKMDTLRRFLLKLQSSFTTLESCPPVISCIHGYCIGGAVDLICATDIRYATKDAVFSIKEVDVGLAPDLGTLQRIERIMKSSSLVRELAFTGRNMTADEALSNGLVSRLFASKEEMINAAQEVAASIAAKSPVAVAGIKQNLNYSRGRPVEESLEYQAVWSAAALQAPDVEQGLNAAVNSKRGPPPKYPDLTKF